MTGSGLIRIEFTPRRCAQAIVVPPDVAGARVIARFGLPPAKAVVAINGGTTKSKASMAMTTTIVDAVGGSILGHGWTAVTGGTDAGIFALLGRAADPEPQDRCPAPWIGVAPLALVTWPGHRWPDSPMKIPLEPHHSHFVLVEGARWGDETPALLALTSALARDGVPSAAVIAGGGAGTGHEAAGHARAGRPIVVLAGSGRFADRLAHEAATNAGDDDLADIVRRTKVVVCDIHDPATVSAALRSLLGG